MITNKAVAIDILVKEHMAVCADDRREIEHMLRHGCLGYEKASIEELENELSDTELILAYDKELMCLAVIAMAQQTWGCIGTDIFVAMGKTECDASTVREVISDADHMAAYGGNTEAYEWLQKQERSLRTHIMKRAFPEGLYSL